MIGPRFPAGRGVIPLVVVIVLLAPPLYGQSAVERGRAVLHAGGCIGCHTAEEGEPLAGGRPLKSRYGTFYSPNITPDLRFGIGRWSVDQFDRAMRQGVAPDGHAYYPSFPYPAYSGMTDRDVKDLKAYLDTRTPVSRQNRKHDLSWYLNIGLSVTAWRSLYFTPQSFEPNSSRSALWNRGRYLVEVLGHCGECHTPRTALGGLLEGRGLSGAREGPDGESVPNITPDRESGIGRWSRSELVEYLSSGMNPEGDFAGGGMAEVIDNGLTFLDPGDLEAIAEYLLSQPAITTAH